MPIAAGDSMVAANPKSRCGKKRHPLPAGLCDDPWFYLSRGCARSNVGLWEQAVDDFSSAIDRGVDDPYVWQYRGDLKGALTTTRPPWPIWTGPRSWSRPILSIWIDRHLALMARAATPLAREWAEENYSRAVELVGLAIQPSDDKLYKRWWNYSDMEGEDAEFFGWQRLFADLTRTINRGSAPVRLLCAAWPAAILPNTARPWPISRRPPS